MAPLCPNVDPSMKVICYMSVSHISRRFLASRIVSLHTTCCVGFTKNINFQYPRVIDVNRVRYFYTKIKKKKKKTAL